MTPRVHASNEASATKDLRTLCAQAYAGDTKASRGALATLVGPLRSADGVTRETLEPIMFGFDKRVTCPACISVVRSRVAKLQAGLGTVERPAIEGCGDTSCECVAPGGMSTNGGCNCSERTKRAALQQWRRYAMELEARVPAGDPTPAVGSGDGDGKEGV